MSTLIEEKVEKLYRGFVDKRVLLRKKSFPNYLIVGKLIDVIGSKIIVQGNKDTYTVDFEDILSIDVKGEEVFDEEQR